MATNHFRSSCGPLSQDPIFNQVQDSPRSSHTVLQVWKKTSLQAVSELEKVHVGRNKSSLGHRAACMIQIRAMEQSERTTTTSKMKLTATEWTCGHCHFSLALNVKTVEMLQIPPHQQLLKNNCRGTGPTTQFVLWPGERHSLATQPALFPCHG